MKKNTFIFIHILTLIFLLTLFVIKPNKYVFIVINIYIYLNIYFLYRNYDLNKKEEEYIEEKIQVAQKDVLNTPDVVVMIRKGSGIVWANDNAYELFPHIKEDRSVDFLLNISDNNILEYNNRIFRVFNKEETYFLLEITTDYRKQKKLTNVQTIIGFFQIDNIALLKNTMDAGKYINFSSEFVNDILKMFLEEKIYYKQIDDKTYYLNIPYQSIQENINDRFKSLGEIIKKYHNQDIDISTTMGIAYNYSDIDVTGQKAQEALELGISRGGAQIVIFDNDKKLYFGGGLTTDQGSYRLRARIISNSLLRLLNSKDCAYLVTHKYPDYDGISSMLAMYEFLTDNDIKVKIFIDSQESIDKFELNTLDFADDIVTDYTIDKTKENILIALDTQSKKILSHVELLEELNDVIVIDHHQTPSDYFRGNLFSWIEPNASSTIELVLSILSSTQHSIKRKFINDMAMLGVLTDTNKFRYRTSHQTLHILMNIVEKGSSINKGLEKLYLTKEDYLQKNKYIKDIMFINGFSFLEIDHEIGDVLQSIIVDDMLAIKEVSGAVVCSDISEEFEKKFRIKIRTKNNINAKNLIEEFGGGGHFLQAAGILNLENKNKFIQKIRDL